MYADDNQLSCICGFNSILSKISSSNTFSKAVGEHCLMINLLIPKLLKHDNKLRSSVANKINPVINNIQLIW